MILNYTLNELLLFLIALFAVFSPFAVIGPYAVFTKGYSKRIQHKIAFRVSLSSALVLIVCAWAGEALLRYLGISVEALGAAGGLVLILSSLPMILKGESSRKKVHADDGADDDEDWETMVVSSVDISSDNRCGQYFSCNNTGQPGWQLY